MSDDYMRGDIVTFDVTARCPVCDNETEVNQDELSYERCTCQHCYEEFLVSLA